MKVKEIDRTANVAWSPAAHHPIYLASGTAAQQLDATFSTTAALEIYSLNFAEPGLDMVLKGNLECNHRFYKVAWGCHGMSNNEHPSGLIVGGTESGNLLIYDPCKLINGEPAEVFQSNKHEGPIYGLDFNLFQTNLLSSGAGDSEIYIWDLNNPDVPITPGPKSQPLEDVSCIAWNKQVQHILASSFPSRCVIWDLRKSEPIIKVAESASKLRYKAIAWHPEVATQLCLASEDDHLPVIQLWDLRFATTPLKSLEHHQRGVLSIAWCPHDPDLLLSCGKDSRILCWNPNSNIAGGQVLCELSTTTQWSFDVTWCPRNPSVIASSSFDGHISIYSLMGSQHQSQASSKVEAFSGSDSFNTTAIHQSSSQPISHLLQKAPKWLKRPVGASFCFGGKLVNFSNQHGQEYLVTISQVVTENELLKRASEVERALNNGELALFCQKKLEAINSSQEQLLWSFLQASFDSSPRSTMLSLLGFNPSEFNENLSANSSVTSDVTQRVSNLSVQERASSDAGDEFDVIASHEKEELTLFEIKTDETEPDSMLTKALLTGNIEAAVNLCIKEGRWSEALVLAQAGGAVLMASTQKAYLSSADSESIQLIAAVVTCNWKMIVTKCELACWKEALAAVLTYAKPEEFSFLCEKLGARLEKEESLLASAMLCYICAGNLEKLANCWLKMNPEPTPILIQDLVEQVVILKQTVEQVAGSSVVETGSLSNLLGKYAEILATQGSLSTAMTYIINISEPNLNLLRDRISCALGLQSAQCPFKKVEVQSHFQQPKPAVEERRSSIPATPPAYQPPQMSPPFSQAPTSFNYTNQPSYTAPFTTTTSVQQTPVPTVPSFPNPQSTEPVKKGPLSHRYPSHLHDPSVYSQPSYNQPAPYQPMGHNYTPQTFYSMENSRTSQPIQSTPYVPSFQQYESMQPPSAPSPGMNQVAGNIPPLPPQIESKSGWNDPPPFKSSSSKQRSAISQPQQAVVAPLGAPLNPEPVPPPAVGNFFTPYPEQPVQQPPAPQTQMAPEPTPETVKEKGPIPPEHQVLQDTLEDLRQQCQQVASNPQMRRKLDDVARKLENLYDKLRDNMLSNNTTSGLHQLMQSIQQGDYQASVLIHSKLVSSGNFSETSSFLPGLKVLVQIAQQLGVYLR